MATPVNVPEHLDNLRIAVKQEDCDIAVKSDQYNCALVRAIQRTFPDAVNVRVNTKSVRWSDVATDMRYEFPTPQSVIDEIITPNDKRGPEAIHPHTVRLKDGTMRERDHDTRSRRARKEREAERTRRNNPEFRERGSQKAKAAAKANEAGYQRFSPDR